MNYFLTADELHTLAALMGASAILEPEQKDVSFDRQTVIANVLRLTGRGVLKRDAQGFACQPEIRDAVCVIAEAKDVILVSDMSGNLPQLMCYRNQERTVLLSEAAERPGTFRITAPNLPLRVWLEEAEYLPMPGPEPDGGSADEPTEEDEEETAGWLLEGLPQAKAMLERLDPRTGERLSSRILLGAEDTRTVLDDSGVARPYRPAELDRWLNPEGENR